RVQRKAETKTARAGIGVCGRRPFPTVEGDPMEKGSRAKVGAIVSGLLLAAAAGAAALLLVGKGSDGKRQGYVRAGNGLLAAVSRADHELAASLLIAKQPGSLTNVAAAADLVSTAVTRAQGAADVLQVPATQQHGARYLDDALASNLAYAQRVAGAARS